MNIFFLIILNAISIRQDSKPDDIVKIEFTSTTRGYQEQVSITHDSILVSRSSTSGKVQSSKLISRQEWKKIITTFSNMEWAAFDSLQSPTNKRTFDGARHSALIITTKTDGTHNHLFDDENPNAKLSELMKCVRINREKVLKGKE